MCNHWKLRQTQGRRMQGFTLIELMIVAAIVAVIAAIAFPSYNDQVRKSRRSDATASFVQIQQAQERWRANNPAYSSVLDDISVTTVTSAGYYDMALNTVTSTGYVATATAVGGKSQASDTGCTILTVTVLNGAGVNTPPECWSK